MYCRNCGERYVTEEAIMCVKCGCAKGTGNKFCPNCGQPTNPESMVCLSCGISLKPMAGPDSRSKLAAGLFGIFLGGLGIHNFYLGYTQRAVLQLTLTIVGYILSCIGIGALLSLGIHIWGLVEGIMILTGKIDTDGQGRPLKE